MEVQAERMTAEEALVLADRLRRRSEIEGGLPGLLRLAARYEEAAREALRSIVANDNLPGGGHGVATSGKLSLANSP